MRRSKAHRTFEVYDVLAKSGFWERRAYEIDAWNEYRKGKPPTRLQKRFVCRCTARSAFHACGVEVPAKRLAGEERP